MRVVEKVALWVLSWFRASYTLLIDRPALETSPDDPLAAYCHRIQWEILPMSFQCDYYVLHDLDLVEKWEPSDTLH